jgi:hypothetical protein
LNEMLNRFRTGALIAAAIILLPAISLAQSKPSAASRSRAPQPGDEIVVPANTQIPLALASAISSRTAYAGEPIYCQTVYPVDVNNRIVIPVGTYVKGTITQVKRAGHIHRRAMMGLRFESMILPGGFSKDFSGTLAGFAGNGKEGFNKTESKIKGAGDKGKDAETIAISGAEGAGIGSIAGISSGHSGAGAAAGGIGGAIAGTIFVLAGRGKEIVLPTGTNLQLELTRPLVFYRYQVDPIPSSPSGPAFPKRVLGPG